MSRDALLRELRSLSRRELQRTLGLLEAEERRRVLSLVEAIVPAEPEPSFQTLVGLSPWLLKAIGPAGSSATQARRTPATQRALAAVLHDLAGKSGVRQPGDDLRRNTLIGRMLSRRAERVSAR